MGAQRARGRAGAEVDDDRPSRRVGGRRELESGAQRAVAPDVAMFGGVARHRSAVGPGRGARRVRPSAPIGSGTYVGNVADLRAAGGLVIEVSENAAAAPMRP